MVTREAFVTLGWLHLITANCWSVQRCPENCSCSSDDDTEVFSIDCAEQSFTALPVMLQMCHNATIPSVYHFNFSYNNLSELDNDSLNLHQDFREKYLARTEVLDLSHNQLRTVSGLSKSDLTRLKVIYLHANQLTQLEDAVLQQLSHTAITLQSNPWQCSCAMQSWLRAACNDTECGQSVTIQHPNEIQCWRGARVMSALEADLHCVPKSKRTIPTYVSAIIGLVLFYLLGCAFAAMCIVIRNRHKVKATDLQLR